MAVTLHHGRPNVLLICTDQQFAGALSCAGNDDLKTPNMDRLAAEGIRFTDAYCPSPVCGPSRAAMFSGEPTHVTGVTRNREPYREEVRDRTLGHLLSDGGYDCAYAGKWHVPEHAIEQEHGFERLCGYNDHRVPEAASTFLERDHDAPFCLVASFDNPHNICEWARNQPLPWGGVDVPEPSMCPTLPTNFEPGPYEPAPVQEYREGTDMAGATPDEWRQYRYAYYRLVERIDDALGTILTTLEAEGLDDDTVVVFTSDHGDMNAAHRLQQKSVAYEESVRVPLIVSGPRVPSDQVDNRLVSLLDLVPTLCDYAGVELPKELPGRSLREVVSGEEPGDWRDYLITECTQNLTARMVRTDQYKYVVYEQGRPREQLFDMVEDRGEQVNLAVDEAHADVLDEHREYLLEWCVDTDDRFMSHYATGIDDLPAVPGFEYAETRERVDRNPERP